MANPFLPSPSHRNRSTGGGSMKAEGGFTEVCVVDIIMNPEHEYWDQFGGWDGMGTIFFKKINKENVSYETKNPQESSARPFFANQKYYPLINERVLIFSTITKDVLARKGQDGYIENNYYLPNLNIWNHPHHNALPYLIKKEQPDNIAIQAGQNLINTFKKTINGVILRQPQEGNDNPKLGNYFEENPIIKPLLPYEGDHIIEGRFGNSIRFGATTPFEDVRQKRFSTSIQPIPNIWSQFSLGGISKTHPNGEGKIGDPIIIIRNEQPLPRDASEDKNGQDKKGWIPTTENINKDGSSIYMTSNQLIPIEVAGSKRKSDALISNDSYDEGDKATNKELLVDTYEYAEQKVEEFVDEVNEFLEDPVEYIAPTPEPMEFGFEVVYDDGQNDFSFVDELIATGQYDDDDFEYASVNYENEEISGTELDETEELEAKNSPIKISSTTGEPIDPSPSVKREAYVKGTDGVPRIEGTKQYNQWVDDYTSGKVDYPFLYVNPKSGDGYALDVVVNPRPVSEIIAELTAEGVNGTNYPEYDYLMLHTSATGFQSQHKLMHNFMSRKWRRPGYHLSVSGDGLVNYNVNFAAGESHGGGGPGNAFNVAGGVGGLFIGGGTGGSGNCIHISWIGGEYAGVSNLDLAGSAGSVNNIDITPSQASAYQSLVYYFMEKFPKIKIIGHCQTTISGGTGKSCPMFDPIEFGKQLGYGDRVWPKHISDYTNEEKRRFKNFNKYGPGKLYTKGGEPKKSKAKDKNGVLFSNFGTAGNPYYGSKRARKTAQYVVVLGGGDVMEGKNLLDTDFA